MLIKIINSKFARVSGVIRAGFEWGLSEERKIEKPEWSVSDYRTLRAEREEIAAAVLHSYTVTHMNRKKNAIVSRWTEKTEIRCENVSE